jgi:hypothetical protein
MRAIGTGRSNKNAHLLLTHIFHSLQQREVSECVFVKDSRALQFNSKLFLKIHLENNSNGFVLVLV